MNNKNIEKPWWREGVILFTKVSSYIAFPVILASLAGNYLDKKYNTEPFMFFILIFISFACTMLLIWREMKVYKRKIDKEEKEEKNN